MYGTHSDSHTENNIADISIIVAGSRVMARTICKGCGQSHQFDSIHDIELHIMLEKHDSGCPDRIRYEITYVEKRRADRSWKPLGKKLKKLSRTREPFFQNIRSVFKNIVLKTSLRVYASLFGGGVGEPWQT